MAKVRNISNHPIDLTGGRMIAPLEEADNVDTAIDHEAWMINAGLLLVVDPLAPAPAKPPTQLVVIASGVQPVDQPGTLWIPLDANGNPKSLDQWQVNL